MSIEAARTLDTAPVGRVRFLGVPVDAIDMEGMLSLAHRAMATRTPMRHCALNVAKYITLRTDPLLRRDVMQSDVITADGMGIVWGARLLGLRLPGRVTGVDLMERLMALCAEHGYRPFILGAREDVLGKAVARLQARYPGLVVAGMRHGYFTEADEPAIVEQIRASKADCLFIAISSPKKERFSGAYFPDLGVPFVMGVGGAVDVIAGLTRRAPVWMQKSGLEWLYRLLQEPRRLWWRYARTNTLFAWIVLKALIGGHAARTGGGQAAAGSIGD